MSFALGYAPQDFTVYLTPGADFVSGITREDGAPWDSDVTITLDIGPDHAWTATIAGADASWNVDQLDVDAALADRPSYARLWYVEGDVRLLWATGRVSVRG